MDQQIFFFLAPKGFKPVNPIEQFSDAQSLLEKLPKTHDLIFKQLIAVLQDSWEEQYSEHLEEQFMRLALKDRFLFLSNMLEKFLEDNIALTQKIKIAQIANLCVQSMMRDEERVSQVLAFFDPQFETLAKKLTNDVGQPELKQLYSDLSSSLQNLYGLAKISAEPRIKGHIPVTGRIGQFLANLPKGTTAAAATGAD